MINHTIARRRVSFSLLNAAQKTNFYLSCLHQFILFLRAFFLNRKKNLQSLLSVLLAQHDAILEFSLLLDDSAAQHKTKPSQSVRSHAMNEMSHIQTSTNAIMQYLLDLYRSTCSYWCPTAYNSVSKDKYEVGNRSALCFEQSITISMILFRILSKVFSENALQTSTLLEFCFSKLDELELASPTAQFYKMKKTNIYIHWIYCTCDRKKRPLDSVQISVVFCILGPFLQHFFQLHRKFTVYA